LISVSTVLPDRSGGAENEKTSVPSNEKNVSPAITRVVGVPLGTAFAVVLLSPGFF